MAWTKQQARLFARRVRQRAGDAWGSLLSNELRRALVADEIVSVLLGQADDEHNIRVGDIKAMIHSTFKAAGLRQEEGE